MRLARELEAEEKRQRRAAFEQAALAGTLSSWEREESPSGRNTGLAKELEAHYEQEREAQAGEEGERRIRRRPKDFAVGSHVRVTLDEQILRQQYEELDVDFNREQLAEVVGAEGQVIQVDS